MDDKHCDQYPGQPGNVGHGALMQYIFLGAHCTVLRVNLYLSSRRFRQKACIYIHVIVHVITLQNSSIQTLRTCILFGPLAYTNLFCLLLYLSARLPPFYGGQHNQGFNNSMINIVSCHWQLRLAVRLLEQCEPPKAASSTTVTTRT